MERRRLAGKCWAVFLVLLLSRVGLSSGVAFAGQLQHWAAELQEAGQTYATAVAREAYVSGQVASGAWPLEAYHEYQAMAAGSGQVDSARLLFEYAVVPAAGRALSGNADGLHAAAALGNVELVESLLDSYADPDAKRPDGTTPLHAASLGPPKTAPRIIQLLVAAGADVNVAAAHGGTPLMVAAMGDASAATAALLAAGADPNQKHAFAGGTALSFAAEMGATAAIPLLCAAGADVAAASAATGGSSIHTAAEVGQAGSVEALLKPPCSADPEALMGGDTTPLYMAAQNGHIDVMVALLKAGANPGRQMPRSAAATGRALAAAGAAANSVWLPNAEPANGATPLHAAAESGHAEACRLLVAAGADINDDGMAATPLILAAQYGRQEAVDALLELGADAAARSGVDGATALHKAASQGHASAARSLLRAGADPDSRQRRGGFPAMVIAVGSGHAAVAAELLAAGASVAATDAEGANAMHVAASNGDFLALQRLAEGRDAAKAAVAVATAPTRGGRAPLHFAAAAGVGEAVEALLKAGAAAAIDARDDVGATPLHVAVAAGNADAARALAMNGADLAATLPAGALAGGGGGDTPLLLAVRKGQADVVNALLKAGAPPDVRGGADGEGMLPLVLAVWRGNAAAVAQLLAADADCGSHILVATAADAEPQTLVELAQSKRHFDVLQLLSRGGCDTPGGGSARDEM